MFKNYRNMTDAELLNGRPKIAWNPSMAGELRNASGDVNTTTLGYQYAIQTTTLIRARTIHQRFYQIPIADYIPVIPGEGAWLEDIRTNIVYELAGPFEQGFIGNGQGRPKVQNIGVGLAPITQTIETWTGGYEYNIIEVAKALTINNWDVIEGKMKTLKRSWDLGIQKVAMLGILQTLSTFPGLLTNSNVTSNTSVIQSNIAALNYTDYATLVQNIVGAYRQNCNYTAYPNKFVIPEDDFNGLTAPINPQFPTVGGMKLEYLLKAFQTVTMNKNFQILPLAYGNAAQNVGYVSAGGKFRYVLYNEDPEVLRMDLPIDFILNPVNTGNNFDYSGVAHGQFTGVIAFIPNQVLYFDHS